MHNCRFFELRWKKPMKMMNSIIMTGFGRISAACGCHTGRRRKNNEDNFFFAGRYMASDNNGLGSILEKSFFLKRIGSLLFLTVWEAENMVKLLPI